MEPVNPRRVFVRHAWWAVLAAVVCMVVYILGCVLSKPAWSPDSSKVALLVTPPGDDPNLHAIFTYDVRDGEHRLLDKIQADGVLSGPAWSPDGKWIAYYRVEPSPDPNAPVTASNEPNQAMTNAVLPGFLMDIAKEHVKDETQRFDVKVMAVSPNGKERKVLCTTQWACKRDDLARLMAMSPAWSADSRHVCFAQPLGEVFSIIDLDIVAGRSQALLLSSTGAAVQSPNGQWVATILSDGSKQVTLVLARADGRMQKYVRLDLELEDKDDLGISSELSWSSDSSRILVSAGRPMLVVNAGTGEARAYHDPETTDIAFGIFSPSGDTVYYLCGLRKGDPDSRKQDVDLKALSLKDGKTKRLVRLSEGLDLETIGRFSVSPNGKNMLFRCITKNPAGQERSILILWDGKKTRTIETNPWLDGL
jgi:Tol biopolymer transport system component